MIRLGTEDGPGAFPSIPGNVARDSRGRYYVLTPDGSGPEAPFVFDSVGAFLNRIGREGEGPGEFQFPGALIVSEGDTIHILDPRNSRLSVLSPSYDLIRTIPGMPTRSYAAVRLRDGTYAVNNVRSGSPIHLFDAVGTPMRQLGEEQIVRRGENIRFLAPGRDGTLWVARRLHEYHVEHWSADGTKLGDVRPRSEWFVPYEELATPSPTVPPSSEVTGLWEDSTGLIWIVGQVAAADWTKGLGPERQFEGQISSSIEDYSKLYDVTVDVLDPTDGQILISQRVADIGFIPTIVAPGFVATRTQTQAGWWVLDIWKLESHFELDPFERSMQPNKRMQLRAVRLQRNQSVCSPIPVRNVLAMHRI